MARSAKSDPNTPSSKSIDLTVSLEGIVRIFGKSLYNDFGAIVRELVQNGHDSVVETYPRTGPASLWPIITSISFTIHTAGHLWSPITASGWTGRTWWRS